MPNFNYTQVKVDRFFKEFGWLLQLLYDLEFVERLLSQERDWARNLSDVNNNFDTQIEPSGVDIGVNTSAAGKVFIRITGGGPYTVTAYKANGGGAGDKVCEVAGAAAGTTVTLAAANASGLSIQVKLKNPVTAEATDVHHLQLIPSFKRRAQKIWTGSEVTDLALLRDAIAICDQLAGDVRNTRARVRAALSGFFTASEQVRGARFLGARESALAIDEGDRLSSGTVLRVRGGAIDRLFEVMKDNGTDSGGGGEQDVVEVVPVAGAVTYGTDNVGKFVVAVTVTERTPPCRVVLKVTEGVDTGKLGSEELSVEIHPLNDGQVLPPLLDGAIDPITIKKEWKGPHGITITVTRTLAKTGDNSNLHLSPIADCSVKDETNANTDDGVLHWQIFANGGNFDARFYKDDTVDGSGNYLDANKVAAATNKAANAVFEAAPINSGDPTINWKMGSAPVAGTKGTLSLQGLRKDNGTAGASQDTAEFSVTVTETGKVQRTIRDNTGSVLNSDPAATATIPDTLITAASVFGDVADDVP